MSFVPKAADADHLTAALRRSGVLGHGRVRDVKVASALAKLRSHTFRLHLNYDGDVANAPHSIVLKTGRLDDAGQSSNDNRHEIAFYQDIASAMSPACPVPRCYEAFSDAASKMWHLLLEDLTESHFIATEWPLPPDLEPCDRIVRAWAHFHAAWWDDPRLGVSVGKWRDTAAWTNHLRNFEARFSRFTDRFGDLMPPDRRDLYDRFLDQAPRLLARYATRRNLTIVHGDAHVWNCFLPREAGSGHVRLIDWENWSINAGADDLAYMMAMHWYPDRRGRIERSLLDSYHAALLAHGVSGYDRQALDDDYRRSTLWLITRPIWQAAANVPSRVWWNNLERIMMAVDDLGCRDLLD